MASLAKERKNTPDLTPGPGRLELQNVSLGQSVRDVSVIAEQGMKVAIIGPEGSGKSSLIALVARLLEPEKGRILIDGQDISRFSLSSVKRSVGIVSPDLPLLSENIDENIRYRCPDAPGEEVNKIYSLFGVDDLKNRMKKAGQIGLTEMGKNLSSGQRQRIALARSFLGNPSLLLFDEADSHLDRESLDLFDRLLTFYSGTVLYITQSAERVFNADIVWIMEKGRIVASGRPVRIVGANMRGRA